MEHVFQFLPYGTQIYAENELQLQYILSNLRDCANLEQKIIIHWCKALEKYIHLKNPIPPNDLELLITNLLSFVLQENDITTQTRVITTILELISCYDKYNKIQAINEHFQINWKDLFHILNKNHFIEGGVYCGNNPLRYNLHAIKTLIQKSRKYFLKNNNDNESTQIIQEILQTFFSSKLSVIAEYSIHIRQGLISLFVPTNSPVASSILIPFIFENWKLVENCKSWDVNWLGILGRLSDTSFRTSNFKVWEKSIISEIFTQLIKILDISIPNRVNKPKQNSVPTLIAELFLPSIHYDNDIMRYISKIIAYTLSEETETLNHYIQLIDLIYSYFHPSNGGEWSAKLGKLILFTSQLLESRLSYERDILKKSFSPEILERFALKTFEAAIQGIYSKNENLRSSSQSTMASLSWIYPSILPQLLEKLDQGLVTLNATHQTATSLTTLSQITTALVNPNHVKDGVSYLYSLLENSIPGIDTNDLSKSSACLSFYFAVFTNVPLFDLSKSLNGFENEYEEDSPQFIAQSRQMKEISQSIFENFALLFVDRIMLFFSHITNEEDAEYENISVQVTLVVNLFFAHLSPTIRQLVLAKVYNYVTNNIETNAKFEFSVIMASLSRTAPDATLDLFIPYYASLIQTINDVPSFDKNDSTEKLEWDINLLSGIVDGSTGDQLVKYQSQIMNIIRCCLLNENKSIFKLGIEITRNILYRLTETYITEYKYFRNIKEIRWGKLFKLHEVHPTWFQPSDIEINFAINIINELYDYTKFTLRDFIQLNIEESEPFLLRKLFQQKAEKITQRIILYRGISILRLILEGGDLLFQSPNIYHRSPIDIGSSRLIFPTSVRDDVNNPVVRFNDHLDKIYFEMGDFIHQLYLHLSVQLKDDTHNLKFIAKVMKIYLTGGESFESEYRNHYMIYYSLKKKYNSSLYVPSNKSSREAPPNRSKYLFYEAHLTRIMSLHLSRVTMKKYCKINQEIHRTLLNDLFVLSFNPYLQVRENAQYQFKEILKVFPQFKRRYMNELIANITLTKSSSDINADKIKGSLHLIMGNSFFKMIIANWKLQVSFIQAITSQLFYYESNSVQKLIYSLILSFNSQYHPLSLSSQKKNNLSYYNNIISVLFQSISSSETNNSNNWKFKSMVACLLYFYQTREDIPTSIDIFRWFLNSLTSDILPVRSIALFAIPSIMKISIFPSISYLQLGNYKEDSSQQNTSQFQSHQNCDYLSQFRPSPLSDNQKEIFDILFQYFLKNEEFFTIFLRYLVEGRSLRAEEEDSNTKISNFIYSIRSSLKTRLSSTLNQNLAKQLTFDIFRNATLLRFRNSFPFTKGKLLSDNYSVEVSRLFATVFSILMIYSDDFRGTLKLLESRVKFIHEKLIDENSYQIEEEKRARLYAEIYGGLIRSILYNTTRNISSKEYSEYWTVLSGFSGAVFQVNFNNWGSTEDVATAVRYAFSLIDPNRYLNYFISNILSIQNNIHSNNNNNNGEDKMEVEGNDDWLLFLSNLNIPSQRHLKKLVCLAELLIEANYQLNTVSINSNGKEVIFTEGLLNSILQHMDHPYLQIRVAISSILYLIFVYSWKSNNEYINNCLSQFISRLSSIIAQKETILENNPINSSTTLITEITAEKQQLVETTKKSLSNTLETVILFVMNNLHQSSVNPLNEYINILLSIVFKGITNNEKDVTQKARGCLALAALSFYDSKTLSKILTTVISTTILYSENWRVREVALPFLQLIAFNHRFVLSRSQLKDIHEDVIKLLNDQQIEVRELASSCLSSLLRGSSGEYISQLALRFEKLASTKLVMKRRIDSDTLDITNFAGNLQRYSGILGLIALVKLAPYDIPTWYPRTLLSLVKHVDDPIVISKAVKKALQDFWRTHFDMWETCKDAFSQDELDILNGLMVSPSYYA